MSDITVTVQDGVTVNVTVAGGSSVTVDAPASSSIEVTNKGPKGDTGATGPAGAGVAGGGTENQVLQKNSGVDYDTKWSAYRLPGADGSANQFLKTDGSGTVSFSSVTQATGNELENVVEDTTPQLGGDLDVNGNKIVSASNGNINIEPVGSGDIVLRPASGEISFQCQTGVEIDGKSFPSSIKFLEADTQSPRHTISFFAPNTWDSNLVFTLPSADGSDGQVLKTNGSGVLSFVSQTTDTNTQLTTEQVQDIVGGMFTGNTETRISATYEDSDGTIDLVVDDMTANTQLTTEEVQDIVGAMFSGNTETRISATYEDGDGTIDLVVDDMTANTNLGNSDLTISSNRTVDMNGSSIDFQDSSSSKFKIFNTGTATGTGRFTVAGNGSAAGMLRLGDASGSTNMISLQHPDSGSGYILKLPAADGSANQVLKTDGSGNLSFDTVGDVMVNRKFTKTSSTDGNSNGDVVFLGGTTSMTTGALYHFKSDGTWELADADAAATCDGLLGIALGAASDTDGVLLRGMVTIDHDPGAVGDVLFASTTAGDITATAPSGNGDIVRVIGYCLDASNGQIWFNPDGAFVEVSA